MRRRVWVIRGGEDNRLVDDFIAGAVVGVAYPDVPDGRTVDRWDVTELLRRRGWTAPETRAEMFVQFVRLISIGDIVVMPDPARREVVLGRVDGDYEFVAQVPVDDCRHRREVTWYGRHGVDALPPGARDLTRQRQVLVDRSSPSLVDHAEAVERGEVGRPAADTAPPPRPATRGATTTRAASPRQPRPPKAPAAPKPAAPSSRSCPGCYLVKSDSLFPPGSDVCVDCV